ncbi:hypothetical protein M0804_013339 [Polistes exclamans]|nr:hypothetical protein M0804_013339 [Polistes exclamans]
MSCCWCLRVGASGLRDGRVRASIPRYKLPILSHIPDYLYQVLRKIQFIEMNKRPLRQTESNAHSRSIRHVPMTSPLWRWWFTSVRVLCMWCHVEWFILKPNLLSGIIL